MKEVNIYPAELGVSGLKPRLSKTINSDMKKRFWMPMTMWSLAPDTVVMVQPFA